MFDFTQNSFSQSFNVATPLADNVLGGALSGALPQDLIGQDTRRDSPQSLSTQQLTQQLSPTSLSTTADLRSIAAFADQDIFGLEDSLDYLSETESDTQASQETDSLLFGGRINQASLDSAEGAFVVGESGSVAINFLFDGGNYTGELAIFTLAGMGELSTKDFAKEAARRALSGTSEGQIVIVDRTEGAQFKGKMGERDRNQGNPASTKTLTLATGTRFAFMLVPNSTVAAVASGETVLNASSSNTPLFSIAAYNPGGHDQLAQAAEGIFAMEDLQIGKGDADFNDIIFQVEGATSSIPSLSKLVNPGKIWLTNPTAKAFLPKFQDSGEESPTPPENPIDPNPVDPNPIDPPIDSTVTVDISSEVNKFGGSTSVKDIIATGANSVTFGSQTVYIGTEQVSSNNQNPIIRSFDPDNLDNNWIRQDLETTGIDSRGLGLIWTGTALYGVFSVDGTQGTTAEDFRRASGAAQQNWLRSYGTGGGAKAAVIGQIDPITGALLKAAYLSAVNNGRTNSLSVTGATVNSAGNLVISAKSFFSPRRPNGTAMTKDPGNEQGSPYDYTVEITPDLTKVISTAAVGWR